MSDSASLEIGFTQVLYGVVVASAITQLRFGFGVRNVMLLLTLTFILGDWIEYQVGIQNASETATTYVIAFVLDVVILIVWYLMTVVPAANLDWFFATAGAFFLLQAVWDRLVLEFAVLDLVKQPHLRLAVFFMLIAGVERVSDVSPLLMLLIAAVAFVLFKLTRWRTLVAESPDAI